MAQQKSCPPSSAVLTSSEHPRAHTFWWLVSLCKSHLSNLSLTRVTLQNPLFLLSGLHNHNSYQLSCSSIIALFQRLKFTLYRADLKLLLKFLHQVQNPSLGYKAFWEWAPGFKSRFKSQSPHVLPAISHPINQLSSLLGAGTQVLVRLCLTSCANHCVWEF